MAEAVTRSGTNYRLLFEYATEGVFVTDESGRYIDANEIGLAMLGYDLDELRTMSIEDVVVASDLRGQPLRLAEIHAGETVSARRWLRRKDGSEFLAEISGRQLPDTHLLALVRNVTELWRAEQALRESEERYRNLVEGSPLGILIFRGGRIVFANQTMADILGYRTHELVNMAPQQIPQLVHLEDRDMVFERIRTRLSGDPTPDHYEFRAICANGDLRWLEIHSSRIEFDGSVAIQTTAADITERKRTESALAEREEYFRTLIENASDAILVRNPDTSIRYVSPAIEQITGYTPEEFMALPEWTLVDPRDIPRLETVIQAMVQDPSRTFSVSGHLRHRDRSWRKVESTARTLTERGEATGIVISIRDVTERARLEEQLARSQKMEAVGRLAGGIAHDFNNMLTAILAECSLIKLEPDSARESAEEIAATSERAAALIRQLLAFSRQQVIRPTVFSAASVLEDIDSMLRRSLGENIELEVDTRDGGTRVFMDRVQLEQVVVNLVVNAADAMPNGGTVRIVTNRCTVTADSAQRVRDLAPGEFMTLSVIDDGVGMSEKVKRHAFEPFFTTKEEGQGTGLGLATCYGIVTRFGGSIELHSERGIGTRVEVLLPVDSGGPSQRRARDEARAGSSFGGTETILLVENNKELQRITARLLQNVGYRVITADDGLEALKLLEQQEDSIDLVFSDIIMANMDGYTLAQKIQEIRPGLPTILTSGFTQDARRREELGSNQWFLPKPYSLEDLGSMLREALRTSRNP